MFRAGINQFLAGVVTLAITMVSVPLPKAVRAAESEKLLSLLDVRVASARDWILSEQNREQAFSATRRTQASRLQDRLLHGGSQWVSLSAVATALEDREKLRRRNVEIEVKGSDGKNFPPLTLSVSDHPEWLHFHDTSGMLSFDLDQDALEEFFVTDRFAGLTEPSQSTITELQWGDTIDRVRAVGVARPGYRLTPKELAAAAKEALVRNEEHVLLSAEFVPAHVENATGLPLGELTLLAEGRSDFVGSTEERRANIEKGLGEISNVLIPAGGTFSLNHTISPVLVENGWKEALGIFGNNVTMTPGGGLCQVATTLYRAALLAGLPILERESHSLYVRYYEKYGVGIDATIFQGIKDLRFRNDTGNYLLVQTATKGTEAEIRVFGTPDGRQVALDGPYFFDSPEMSRVWRSHPLQPNQIAWIRTVRYRDGSENQRRLVSTYRHPSRLLSARVFAGKDDIGI